MSRKKKDRKVEPNALLEPKMVGPKGPITGADVSLNSSVAPPTAMAETPPQAAEGNGKRKPVLKVGPIPTSRDDAVSACVWENVVKIDGKEETVHTITVDSRYRDADGDWKSGRNFRGSQVYALVYCLTRCSEWILAQRDPAASPF